VVLFLQWMRLRYGTGTVLEGAAIAAVLIAAVGALTFVAHRRIPDKRMLAATGVLIGIVFVGTVGETVQEWQLGGWLPTTPVGVHIPGWVGTWLATFPTAEGLILQGLALAFVVGSYLIAEELRYRRPVRKGARPAARLTLRRTPPPPRRRLLGWCRGRRSRPLGTPRGVTPEGHRRSDARDGPSVPRMSSDGNIWQAISRRQPAGAAASTRHRPVPAERPVERYGPTPATASANSGRASARPSRPHPPWHGRNVSVLVGCPSHSPPHSLADDRTCSARTAPAWYEVSLHNTCERSSGPLGLGASSVAIVSRAASGAGATIGGQHPEGGVKTG
jgi:hypothetical protein